MAIKLKALTNVFDITDFVDYPIKYNHNLVGLYDTAEIVIPYIKDNQFYGIDLSLKIPRFSIVEINDVSWFVENSVVIKKGLLYEHTLKLTEPKILLADRPVADNGVTQSQGDAVTFTTESSRVTTDLVYNGEYGATIQPIAFEVSHISNNTDVIENRQVFEAGDYKINFNIAFGRINSVWPSASAHLKAILKVNGVSRKTYDLGSFGSLFWAMVGTVAFSDEISLLVNDTLSIDISLSGGIPENPVTLNVKSGYLTIEKRSDHETFNPIYMDEVVEKYLKLVNVTGDPEFRLDNTSRARLGTILAYDTMQTEETLKTALERVASYVKARLYVKLDGDGKKTVIFKFFDDMAKQDYVMPNDESKVVEAPSNDYYSGLALQNNNVIRENYLKETLLLVAENKNATQITTENISAFTKYPIDKIKSVIVESSLTVDPVDITNNLREKAHYDTLDAMESYDNRLVDNKNNHIYFVRGDNKLHGLGFVGTQQQKWISNETNRALYETLLTVLYRDDVDVSGLKDTGLSLDDSVKIHVEYYPMSVSNAYIFKDDQSGFEQKRISRLNANDRVNNIDYLGDYARGLINSIGGTQTALKGISDDTGIITELGTINNEKERVVNISYLDYGDKLEYYATHVKDHIFISHYIGIDKDRRLLHVPRDEFVKRVDKSLNIITLMRGDFTYNTSSINPVLFLNTLRNNNLDNKAPEAAYIKFDEIDTTIYIDSSATGNTIEWYMEALDNYSVGMRRKTTTLGAKTITYQVGVAYGNIFGRVDDVEIRIKEFNDVSFNYPEGDFTSGDEYAFIKYNLKKDAREQFALSVQTAILSDTDEIIVYGGFGKYNNMANRDLRHVSLAVLNYIPNRDDKYIDYGRIIPQTNNTTIFSAYIHVVLTQSGQAYAWYDTETGELLLAVKGVEIGSNRVYYKSENYNLDTDIHGGEQYMFDLVMGASAEYVDADVYDLNLELEVGLPLWGLGEISLNYFEVDLMFDPIAEIVGDDIDATALFVTTVTLDESSIYAKKYGVDLTYDSFIDYVDDTMIASLSMLINAEISTDIGLAPKTASPTATKIRVSQPVGSPTKAVYVTVVNNESTPALITATMYGSYSGSTTVAAYGTSNIYMGNVGPVSVGGYSSVGLVAKAAGKRNSDSVGFTLLVENY